MPSTSPVLAPGVTGAPAGTYTSDNQTQISISGGGATQGNNEIILDGVPDTVPLSSGSVVLVPSVDSIEEVKITTTMFDASLRPFQRRRDQHRHPRRHAINCTATAYLFKRWAALNANSWQNDRIRHRQAAGQLSPVRLLPLRSCLHSQALRRPQPDLLLHLLSRRMPTSATSASRRAFPPIWSAKAISPRR